ncbi:MAG TPA: diguanylate cyclase, partial [Acidobacteria bacterium]|nr:diguanylate cyclase [Acidobacteriota bacterium]
MNPATPETGGWSTGLLEQERSAVGKLRFSPQLEERFRRFLHAQTARQAWIALALSTAVFFLFGALDILLVPKLAGEMWRLRYLVVGPVLIVVLGLLWTPRGQRYLFELLLVAVASESAAIVGFMAITRAHDPQLYYGGLILTVMVSYVFFGLRLSEAAVVGWSVLAIYVVGDLRLIGSDRIHFVNNALGLGGTNLVGMVAAYLIELQHRKVFLQSRLLEREKRELEKANARLRELSYEDGLTGIANRRLFDERLREEWARAFRHGYPIALLMLDVDHFKAYNDSEGHQAGDECLRQIGRLLSDFAHRPGDLAARYGGEEFVVILSGTSRADALAMAERIRHQVIDLGIPHPSSPVADVVTVSVGVVSTVPSPGSSSRALLAA